VHRPPRSEQRDALDHKVLLRNEHPLPHHIPQHATTGEQTRSHLEQMPTGASEILPKVDGEPSNMAPFVADPFVDKQSLPKRLGQQIPHRPVRPVLLHIGQVAK
jgi:hypothetical protein